MLSSRMGIDYFPNMGPKNTNIEKNEMLCKSKNNLDGVGLD